MKMYKIKILIIVLFAISLRIKAQENAISNVVPTSPTAASLGKYGKIPVSGYNGTMSYNIPLFTVKEGDITLPVSLSYCSNGVKPNQLSSWVGEGWNLMAGGVITREQHDQLDDRISTGYFETANIDIFERYWGQHDMERDIFYFNFMGYSGKFYRNNIGTNDNTYLFECSPNYNFKIEYTVVYPRLHVNQFIITTDDGVKYIFGYDALEIESDNNRAFEYTIKPNTNASHETSWIAANAWYLTKIKNQKGDSIELIYSSKDESGNKIQVKTTYQNEHRYEIGIDETLVKPINLGFMDDIGTSTWEVVNNDIITDIYPTYLSKIVTTHATVSFYNSEHPTTILGTKVRRLDKIEYHKNLTLSNDLEYDFHYISDYRLMLDYFEEKDNGGVNKKYDFVYYNEGENKIPLNITKKIDHWGYYNGNNNQSNSYIPYIIEEDEFGIEFYPQREPNEDVAKYDLLKTIVFPTEGKTNFFYESNKYKKVGHIQQESDYIGKLEFSDCSEEKIAGGVRISSIEYDPVNGEKEILNYSYGDGFLYQSPIYNYTTKIIYQNDFVSYYSGNYRNSLVELGSPHVSYPYVIENNGNGTIKTTYKSMADITDRFLVQHDVGDFEFQGVVITPTSKEYLRGKPTLIEYNDENGNPIKKIENVYGEVEKVLPSLKSWEWIGVGNFCTNYFNLPCSFTYLETQKETNYLENGEVITEVTYNYDQNNFQQAHNLFLLKSKNTIDSENNSEIINYKYSSDYSYVLENSNGTSATFDNASNAIKEMVDANIYNRLIETNKNLNDKINSGIINVYDKEQNQILLKETFKLETSEGIDSNVPLSEDLSDIQAQGALINQTFFWQNNFKKDSRLKRQLSFDNYDSYGNLLQYHKENDIPVSYIWGYKNTYPVAKIENGRENGKIIGDEVAYLSFEAGAYYGDDKDENNYWFINTVGAYVNKSITEPKSGNYCYQVDNGHYVPQRSFIPTGENTEYVYSIWVKSTTGVSGSIFCEFRNPTNGSLYSGTKSTSIPNTNGIWKKVELTLDLASIRQQNALASDAPLKLSFNFHKTAGTCYIDDIRFHPKGALMTTYTYDPLIGMTSETDPNGKTTYYEYDSFGHLEYIKDHKGNIIKHYNYHYANTNP